MVSLQEYMGDLLAAVRGKLHTMPTNQLVRLMQVRRDGLGDQVGMSYIDHAM